MIFDVKFIKKIMAMQTITSLNQLKHKFTDKEKTFVLVYKKGVAVSDCAFNALKSASEKHSKENVYAVNAPEYPEIHTHYQVISAPSLLIFEGDKLKDIVKGCHDESYFKQLFESATNNASSSGKSFKSVTVYSTPSCPWCTTLKNFLRKNGVQFTDIDVSRDHEAAQRMVSATGQQGVPQASIGGEWVVGFDQMKIKRLLNLQTE